MPDLHGWITQQIDKVEATALSAKGDTPGVWDDKTHPASWIVLYDAGGKLTLGQHRHIALHDPAAVLRRCAADRKILARHTLDPDVHYEPACKGCGTYGDMELSETDNLNECPELLDLADGYGITPEQLATLDQPVPPPRPARPEPGPGIRIGLLRADQLMQMSEVPPALRGPNWKPRPA